MFTRALQTCYDTFILVFAIASLPVSLNHKASLTQTLLVNLTRALTRALKRAIHIPTPHSIKGPLICLGHLTACILEGTHSTLTLLTSPTPWLYPTASSHSVVPNLLQHLINTTKSGLWNPPFSYLSCLHHHTTTALQTIKSCWYGIAFATRSLALIYATCTTTALGYLILHFLHQNVLLPLANTTSHSIRTWAHLHIILLPILLTYALQRRSSIVFVYLLPNLLLTLLIPTQSHYLHLFPIVFVPLAISSHIQQGRHHHAPFTKTFISLTMLLAFCIKINNNSPSLSALHRHSFIFLQLSVILIGLTTLIFHTVRRISLPRIHPVRASPPMP